MRQVQTPACKAKTTTLVPLGDQTIMNYNNNIQPSSGCPNMLMQQVRDSGGALAEPYASVQNAHVRSGNTQTGSGLTGLANPAQVNETPNHISREANDAVFPGGGSHESSLDTDPDHLGSLNFGGMEAPEDHSVRNSSEEETSESDSSLSSEEDEPAGGNCDNIAFFRPFPLHSDDLRSPQSL